MAERKVFKIHSDLSTLIGSQIAGLLVSYAMHGVPVDVLQQIAFKAVADPGLWRDLADEASEEQAGDWQVVP